MEEMFIPIPERGAYLARLYYGLTIPLLAISIATLAARLYVRSRPAWKVGWDDWSLLIGTVSWFLP